MCHSVGSMPTRPCAESRRAPKLLREPNAKLKVRFRFSQKPKAIRRDDTRRIRDQYTRPVRDRYNRPVRAAPGARRPREPAGSRRHACHACWAAHESRPKLHDYVYELHDDYLSARGSTSSLTCSLRSPAATEPDPVCLSVWCAFVCCCFVCVCAFVLLLEVFRVRFARVSCARLGFGLSVARQ